MFVCDHQIGNSPCLICSTISWGKALDRLSRRLDNAIEVALESIRARNPGCDADLPEGRRLHTDSNVTNADAESPRAKAAAGAKQTIADLRAGHIPEPVIRDLKETCDRALSDVGIGRSINRR